MGSESVVKRIAKNTGFLYVKMGITIFASLYSTRLILNALGAVDFGIFNIVGGAIAMLGFLNAAMASATQRFMSYSEGEGNEEKQKRIFNVSVVLHFFISIAVGLLLLAAGYFFFNGILNIPKERINAAQMVYYCMIVSTIFTVMTVPYDAVLNAHENMLYYAIIGIIESLLKLIVALIVVNTQSDKLFVYGILMASVSLIVMLSMRLYCHRKYIECTVAPAKYFDRNLMKEMTSFAGWNLLGSTSGIVYGYGSNIVLNNFFGAVLNTANAISGQINGQLLAFSHNMQKAVNPVIIKAEGSGDRNHMFRATFMACKVSVLIYSVFAIPFIIESHLILQIWLKNVPAYAEIFLRLMIFQVFIEQIALPLITVISAVGNIKWYNIVSSVILYVSIIAIFGAYKMGYPPETMRYVAIIVAVIQLIYKVSYCSKYCNLSVKEFMSSVFFPCIAVMFIVYTLTRGIQEIVSVPYLRLLAVCIVSPISLILFFYIIALSKSDKLSIRALLKRKMHPNSL